MYLRTMPLSFSGPTNVLASSTSTSWRLAEYSSTARVVTSALPPRYDSTSRNGYLALKASTIGLPMSSTVMVYSDTLPSFLAPSSSRLWRSAPWYMASCSTDDPLDACEAAPPPQAATTAATVRSMRPRITCCMAANGRSSLRRCTMPAMSDEEDIRRLIASYAQLVDDRKYDDWTNLFTPNGTFKPGSGEPRVGHDAIRSYIHAGHGAQP